MIGKLNMRGALLATILLVLLLVSLVGLPAMDGPVRVSYITTPKLSKSDSSATSVSAITHERSITKDLDHILNLVVKRGGIPNYYSDSYRHLLSMGADSEKLSNVHHWHIQELSAGFKYGRFPKNLMTEVGASHVQYSARAAALDSDFQNGTDWARNYIKERLASRKHLSRSGTDYQEDHSGLDSVSDPYILFLIKGYTDFVNEPSTWITLDRLFERNYTKPSKLIDEQGGLIFASPEHGFSFVQIDQREIVDGVARSSGRETQGYRTPILLNYIPSIGLLHTHPLEEHASPVQFAGPSGYSREYEGYNNLQMDTGALRYANKTNPFFIDAVVTELERGKYNFDIYFRDIEQTPDGKAKPDSNITVLDLGIFEGSSYKVRSVSQ